jgi:hypothetical protein
MSVLGEVMNFRTAGYSHMESLKVWPHSRVSVNPQPGTKCGSIEDGVVFQHDQEGAWVLSFADLEKIYLRAKELQIVDSAD